VLKSLKLENFRNHAELEIGLDQVTVMIGQNGAGKSNILESICLLSCCRSFREDDKRNLINQQADFCRVIGNSGEYEIFIQRHPISILRAKYKGAPKKQSDFIGKLRSVVFSPESAELVLGSPRHRRRFIDMLISQKNRDYVRALVGYEKVRLQRNSLLSAIAEQRALPKELEFWNEELIKHGEIIIDLRNKALAEISAHLPEFYRQIAGQKEDCFEVRYLNSAEGGFGAALKAAERREIGAGCTLVGPHRDDLSLCLNGFNLANYGSRGEIRTAILALKLAELEYLSDEAGRPILLLDDVFSEFDQTRRDRLGEIIGRYQTVVTTTDKDHLNPKLIKTARIMEINNG